MPRRLQDTNHIQRQHKFLTLLAAGLILSGLLLFMLSSYGPAVHPLT
jgi:hypothetical protein